MKIVTSFLSSLLLAGSVISLWNCSGSSKKDDPNHIKVGVSADPELSVAEAAKKVAKERYGLEV
jgi:D-methionine transport system substrate-binding protein